MTQAQCDVLFEKRDGIAWLTLNRPEKRNCLNIGIATHVTEHLQDCANDDEIRAVMISANGPAFCAGNDLVEFKNRLHDPVLSREFEATVGRMHESIRLSPKTVVAVVSGYCLGGGITLLGSCDLAIAADTAEFGLPELARGTWPALATTPVMHGLHRKHGLYLILTAKNVRAPEALTMGLVSQVVPAADLKKAAEEIAKTLSGYDPNVLTWAKKIAHDSLDMDYEQSFKYGGFAARTFLTETRSFQQGIGSFLRSEK